MEPKSQLTYHAEGRDEVCCRMHWPGGASGVTIGHGYDLGHRKPEEVRNHFEQSDIDGNVADLLVQSCGLTREAARDFAREHQNKLELTPDQMVRLFNISFDEQEAEVKRICDKDDCVKAYGAVDHGQLDTRIWHILVDLKFRGDYHPTSRKKIQKLVAANDFHGFKAAMEDRGFWSSVPPDRFNRRVDFLNR